MNDASLPAVRQAAASMSLNEMQRLAESVAKSRLFGIQTADQALTLMSIAQAEGRHPALAARDYHIINGSPAKKAEAMARDFLSAGGRIEWHQLDDDAADATFSHPAGGSARIRWDQARVAQAQLKNAMHQKYPRQMLRSRAVSEGVRTVWPMATSGMYVPEEVREFATPGPAIDVTPRAQLDEFAAPPAAASDAALQAAQRGTEAFRTYWRELSSDEKAMLRDDLPRYQQAAEAADRERREAEDPFGLPPLDRAAEPPNSPAGPINPSDRESEPTAAPSGSAGHQPESASPAGEPDATAGLTIPLPRGKSAAEAEYFARQLRALLDEAPRTAQRLATVKLANEAGLRRVKEALPALYDELMGELAAPAERPQPTLAV